MKLKLNLTGLVASVLVGTAALPVLAQTTPAAKPPTCNRACWGARAESCGTKLGSLTRAIIHHTANQNNYVTSSLEESKAHVRGTQNYHMDANGWCGIGYHFLVDKLGNIFEGRIGSEGSSTEWRRGAHDGCNANSMGFSFLGYFHTPYNNDPVAAMRNAAYSVIAWRMPQGWSPYGSGTYCTKQVGTLGTHRNVGATACPGDLLYAYVGTDFNGGEARNQVSILRGGSTPPPPPPSNDFIVDNPAAVVVGSWSTGTSSVDKFGADYRFKSQGTGAEFLQFTPTIETAGDYDVYEWHPAGSNRSAAAPHVVHFNGGSQTIAVDQRVNGGKWNLLGRFNFAAGTTGHVLISDAFPDGTQVVLADAIKFVPVPPATPVHVSSITMTWVKSGSKYKARTVVNVVSQTGGPVNGATVTGSLTGALNESGLSGVTDSSGNATLTSAGSIATGTVTFTVTGIVGTDIVYDPAANTVTSQTITR